MDGECATVRSVYVVSSYVVSSCKDPGRREIGASGLNGRHVFEIWKGESDMSKLTRRFAYEDQGQDLVEYAMLIALIAIVVAVGVTTFGTSLLGFYNGLFGSIPFGS
jgi:Flp pilus assembly pilin Flp